MAPLRLWSCGSSKAGLGTAGKKFSQLMPQAGGPEDKEVISMGFTDSHEALKSREYSQAGSPRKSQSPRAVDALKMEEATWWGGWGRLWVPARALADGKLGGGDSSTTNTRNGILPVTGMSLEEEPESRQEYSHQTRGLQLEQRTQTHHFWASELWADKRGLLEAAPWVVICYQTIGSVYWVKWVSRMSANDKTNKERSFHCIIPICVHVTA